MRMTLKKIGELTDVSVACVSNIINGKTAEYSKETIERVQSVVEKYHYRPNSIAKSMVTKSTMTLGLVLPDINNPYYPELAKGVEAKAFELGYNVIYLNSDEDAKKEKEIFDLLVQKMVDGIIFIPSVNSIENKKVIEDLPVPLVMVDRYIDVKVRGGEIIADDYLGARIATKHLIENGHKNIWFLSGDRLHGIGSDRARGYLDELKENHLSEQKENMMIGNYSVEFGYEIVTKLWKEQRFCDAIFACSDMIAIGAVQALKDLGVSVPTDVSIVGYDDIYMSRYIDPALTTIYQPKYNMGAEAAKMLIELINSKDNRIVERKKVLKPKLVKRNSVN